MHTLNPLIASNYTSNSQKIRVMTEYWTQESVFCPCCGNTIHHYENNRPVADFYCTSCHEDYELKSGKSIGSKITDGAYSTMIERIESTNNPNFFFLHYSNNFLIEDFLVIPKHYFTREIIQKRPPLSPTAKRAGWVGCNILLSKIPESGKIFYIQNGIPKKKEHVLEEYNKTLFLRDITNESRGWLLEIMQCIDILHKKEFSIQELYAFEEVLKKQYPENNFIKDKIRQQLQILRDKGFLEFTTRGNYRVL